MVSISNSYAANYSILASLRRIDKEAAENRKRIATGLRVSSAADDATAFAAAQSIRSDLKATDAIKSGLDIARGRAEATVATLNKITGALTRIQQLLAEASYGDPENSTRDSQTKGYQSQIWALAHGAAVNGANWLNSTAATTTVIKLGTDAGASLTFAPTQMLARSGGGGSIFPVMDIDFSLEAIAMFDLEDSRNVIAAAIGAVASYTREMSGLAGTLSSQSDLLGRMDDVRKSALGSLVDADLSAESARSRALQARQQLAYQALSIGNSKPSKVLALFR